MVVGETMRGEDRKCLNMLTDAATDKAWYKS